MPEKEKMSRKMEHQMQTQLHQGTNTLEKFWPSANLYMKPYIRTVGSATPRISNGCPPMQACAIPEIAVDIRTCTPLKAP